MRFLILSLDFDRTFAIKLIAERFFFENLQILSGLKPQNLDLKFQAQELALFHHVLSAFL